MTSSGNEGGRVRVGDYIRKPDGRLLVVFKVYDDMGPNIHGYGARPATIWERVKFRFRRLVRLWLKKE